MDGPRIRGYALDALLFVSKRLQIVVAALICLAFVQLATADQHRAAPIVRVAISY